MLDVSPGKTVRIMRHDGSHFDLQTVVFTEVDEPEVSTEQEEEPEVSTEQEEERPML